MVVPLVLATDRLTCKIMLVMMVVVIQGKLLTGLATKHRDIRWVLGNGIRCAGAAYMVLKTNYVIGFCHHQMQIVRDH